MNGARHVTLGLVVFACMVSGAVFAGADSTSIVEPRGGRDAECRFVEALVGRMTVEEKFGQLTQYSGKWAETGPAVAQGGEEEIRAGRTGSFLNVWGAEATLKYQRMAVEESRLGIPLLFGFDVVHGFRTVFPIPLAESCSWNPDTAERCARIAAVESGAAGLHWTFAPMVDVARDARWGRIAEGAGEDPWLGAVFAKARVRGFQGGDGGANLAAPDSLLACVKHFAAYGAVEAGRDYNPADISERTLWETYLLPFKAALDAGAGTVMASFNEIGGIPATCDRALLTGILRERWGFDGFVVSDYTAVAELIAHGVAGTRGEAGALALEAGTDMDMVSGIYITDLPGLVKEGRVPMSVVDEAVRRVLRMKYRLGLFSDPYRQTSVACEEKSMLTAAHRAAAREAARESMVLLKNDGGTLPLDRAAIRTIAVIGPLADDARAMLGSWSGAGRAGEAVSPLEGIRAAVSANTRVLYAKGCEVLGDARDGFSEASKVAAQADAIVLVLGEDERMSGEAASRVSPDVPGVQVELAKIVLGVAKDALVRKPVVVVLTNGRPLTIPWLAEHAPAILEAWQPGTEAGRAIADVLFGDCNPSGKLTVTFPRHVGQEPLYYNHKSTGRPPDATNHYTSKYIDEEWTPLFAFGHGLSYTTFAYDAPAPSRSTIRPDETIDVSVGVANAGTRAGEEVVQLYIRDEVASVTRPVMELRGFRKIRLEAGEKKTVTFTLTPDDLAFYDREMKRVVEPGWFTIFAGGSSDRTQQARFCVEGGVSP